MDLTLSGERTLPGIPTENYWYRRAEVAYLSAWRWARGAHLLDVGTGEGYGADLLSRVARRVVALDRDAAVCAHVATHYKDVTVVRGDATALPFADATLDVVVALRVLERVTDEARFLAECARVLRPAGTLVLSTPNRLAGVPDPGPIRFAPSELTGLLGADFSVARLYGVHHGPRLRRLDRKHRGLAAAQLEGPLATWDPGLRLDVASVRSRDFHLTEENVATSLDLFAIAVRH